MWFDPVLNSSWRGKRDKEGKGQVQQSIDKERRKVRMGIRSTKTDLNMSSFLSHMAKLPLIKIRMAWPSSWSLFSMTTIMVLDHSRHLQFPVHQGRTSLCQTASCSLAYQVTITTIIIVSQLSTPMTIITIIIVTITIITITIIIVSQSSTWVIRTSAQDIHQDFSVTSLRYGNRL